MQYDFIFDAFISQYPPPLARVIHNVDNKNYKFAPLVMDGSIYTADVGLWRSCNERMGKSNHDKIFRPNFPFYQSIIELIKEAERKNDYLLFAMTQIEKFSPLGVSSELYLNFEPLAKFIEIFPDLCLVEAGFDVVDCFTGISGLTNIGYCTDDLERLKSILLQSNEFGLLPTESDARRFVDFASSAASEHALFTPLKILIRIPNNTSGAAP